LPFNSKGQNLQPSLFVQTTHVPLLEDAAIREVNRATTKWQKMEKVDKKKKT
jgi:hypothetical protein